MVLFRYVARCTQAEILTSVNGLNFEPRLGTCQKFLIRRFKLASGDQRSFACFEGCAPELGCTIILHGACDEPELKKVSKILLFGAYIAASLRLELASLENECAMIRPPDAVQDTINKQLVADRGLGPASNAETSRFSAALDKVVLSTSPFTEFHLPHLFTSVGSKCQARSIIMKDPYWNTKDAVAESPLSQACLAPSAHQSLGIQFTCMDSTFFDCIPPRPITMEYYGINDIPLGKFVEQHCLRPTNSCPHPQCEEPMEVHIRTFTHHTGRVSVTCERLKSTVPVDDDG